jgi:hypothetical protein
MSTPREEPLEANEADVAEQTRDVDGDGSDTEELDELDLVGEEADPADVQEQRTVVSIDEDYLRG